MDELKHIIRKKRKELKLTQKQASVLFDVSPLTWISWERGQIPLIRHLFLISDWLGVKLDELRQLIPGCQQKLQDSDDNRN